MQEIKTVVEIIKQAGQIIIDGWNKKELQIDYKNRINPVTEVDYQVESFITAKLQKFYPDYGILTEESAEKQGKTNYRWILDPIDGTTNFIRHYPFVAISLALEIDCELIFGIVFNPIMKEMFIAEKGKGAFCNGKAIQVSGIRELDAAVLGSGFPYDAWENQDNNTVQWTNLIGQCQSLRCDGSAALDLCRVASGQLDGYWEKGISKWDIAAGAIIVQEAGGMVSDYLNGPDFLDRGEIIAANEDLHRRLQKAVVNQSPFSSMS